MMTDADYQTLREKLEADFQKDIDALERVRRIMNIPANPNGTPPAETRTEGMGTRRTQRPLAKAKAGRGAILDAGRSIVHSMTADFSMWDAHEAMEKRIGRKINKQTVRYILRRLEKDGEIETSKPGKGRRPAEYRKK